jgi:hypothetical protein
MMMSLLCFLIPKYKSAEISNLLLILVPTWLASSLKITVRSHTRQMCGILPMMNWQDSPDEEILCMEYDSAIHDKLGGLSPEDYRDDPDFGGFDMDMPNHHAYEDERDHPDSMPDTDDAREETPDSYDQHVGASVNVQIGNEIRRGKVTGRKSEVDGTLAGTADSNSMLDTRKCVVDSLMAEVMSTQRILLPNTCMFSAMKRATRLTSWMRFLATRLTVMRSPLLICTSSTGVTGN